MGETWKRSLGEPGALLVASISEAMTRRSSGASASTLRPAWSFRRDSVTGYAVSRALPAVLLQARACSSGSPSASLAESMSFRVSTRRTSALPLLLLGGVAELAEIAQLAPQMLARIGVLVFAQQAVMQQLGDRWRLRNPFRQRGTSSRQVDSQPLGDYIKTPIGNSRASRQAHKLAGQALALERELKMEEAAELFVQAAQLEPSSPEYWARASKVVSDSSYLPGTTPQKAAELNKRALELGIKGKGERANGDVAGGWWRLLLRGKPAHKRRTAAKLGLDASGPRLRNTGICLLWPCPSTFEWCQSPLVPLTCQHACGPRSYRGQPAGRVWARSVLRVARAVGGCVGQPLQGATGPPGTGGCEGSSGRPRGGAHVAGASTTAIRPVTAGPISPPHPYWYHYQQQAVCPLDSCTSCCCCNPASMTLLAGGRAAGAGAGAWQRCGAPPAGTMGGLTGTCVGARLGHSTSGRHGQTGG